MYSSQSLPQLRGSPVSGYTKNTQMICAKLAGGMVLETRMDLFNFHAKIITEIVLKLCSLEIAR